MVEYTVSKIENNVGTITYSDGSTASVLLKSDMTEAQLDAIALDFSPKASGVPSFVSEGWKGDFDEHSDLVAWTEAKTKTASTEDTLIMARNERDTKLSESDWIAIKASEEGVAVSNNWKTYRQALRDLPASWSPKLGWDDTTGVIVTNVTWPTKPS